MIFGGGGRHPWPNVWFVGLLLLLYEGGRWWLVRRGEEPPHCGVELWWHWLSDSYALPAVQWLPVATLGLLLLASLWRWKQRPPGVLRLLLVMCLESICAAVLLWWIGRNFELLCQRAGLLPLSLTVQGVPISRLLGFVGAGIYEEILFRLGLFTFLYALLRLVLFPALLALPLAAVAAASLFALAHHVGPWGEAWRFDYFLFRLFAGLYFTLLYVLRGLGTAVGAHVVYDLFVGLTQPPAA